MTEREYFDSADGPSFRPKVFFSYPTLGEHIWKSSAIAAMQVRFANGAIDLVGAMSLGSSNLERNFNGSLMQALDLAEAGKCTHFAMLHADVAPPGNFVDLLWAEMQKVDADVVSAVIPIKEDSPNPRTSTAIATRGNVWHPKRFVHLWDRESLPETFCGEDVCDEGELLLLNTGCWLADLRRPWWRKDPDTNAHFAFHRLNRIIRDPDDPSAWIEQTSTEDWLLSHYLDRVGARYYATWAVPCTHWGDYGWPNRVEIPEGYVSKVKSGLRDEVATLSEPALA